MSLVFVFIALGWFIGASLQHFGIFDGDATYSLLSGIFFMLAAIYFKEEK